ncbi:hypothetical protein HWV62_24322 [Athelia sp. TMB]|nr:hypothetical protein HWV62_24322 [Athelia sp. TMB]
MTPPSTLPRALYYITSNVCSLTSIFPSLLSMLATISDVADKSFDYVVVGAGTAGLAVAARLSEDPNVSVAVLEAGPPNLNDPKILLSAQFAQTFKDPKPKQDGLAVDWARGKGLGGTSGMNFLCYIRPPAEDIDAIGKLGNDGWNWENYLAYAKLSESFHPAALEHTAVYPHTSVLKNHGTSGPVQTSTPHHVHTVDLLFRESCKNRGLPLLEDPYGGDITGMWMASATMDPKTWTRSNAATAYYVPNKDRKNFTVLTEAFASRVLFADANGDADITATGVEFIHEEKTYTVHAKKEVVLSAGTIKSPHILELSGIGRPEILKSIGVPVKVDLPGVGENLQEHCLANFTLEMEGDHETLDKMRDADFLQEQQKLHASGKGLCRTGITSFAYFSLETASPTDAPAMIKSLEAEIDTRKANAPPGLKEQWDLQLEILRNNKVPDLEIVVVPGYMIASTPFEKGKSYLTMELISQHPFSRGHIHATSKNPLDAPAIDPKVFDFDYDLESMVQLMEYARSLKTVEPWKSAVRKELDPAPNATHEELRDYIKKRSGPCWRASLNWLLKRLC